jgi:hypothetical protein
MTDRPEHDPVLAERGECECFGCHIHGGVFLGKPSDFPTRTRVGHASASTNNSWERGIAKDDRGLPVLNAQGDAIGLKEAGEKRHLIEETRRRRAQIERPW